MPVARAVGFTIALLGVLFALWIALVPQKTGAYYLAFGMFVWGALPYLLYALYVAVARHAAAMLGAGLVALPLDALFRIAERTHGGAPMAFVPEYLPLWVMIVFMPLGFAAGYAFSGGAPEPEPTGEHRDSPDS